MRLAIECDEALEAFFVYLTQGHSPRSAKVVMCRALNALGLATATKEQMSDGGLIVSYATTDALRKKLLALCDASLHVA